MSKLFITNKLAEIRDEMGWTQGDLAEVLTILLDKRITLQIISKWEVGERPIKAEDAMEISKLLAINFKELVIKK